jgi:hypothetical protein
MNSARVTPSAPRSSGAERGLRDERGAALLIAVVLLLLMSALGITALQHAQDEAAASGRSRRKDATLYAAEAGLAQAQSNLLVGYASPTGVAPSFTIDQPALVSDGFGNPIAVRTGRPESAIAQSVDATSASSGEPPDGYQIGAGGGYDFRAVRVDIVATDSGNGTVHLQAQYRLYGGSGGGHYQ